MAQKRLYLFAGERYMAMKSLHGLIASLNLPLAEINVTGFKTMPEADALIEACAALPLMAEKRLVYVSDYTALSGKESAADEADGEEEEENPEDEETKDRGASDAKKLAEYLPRMPETTVLALCCEGRIDRRRALCKRFAEAGVVREFPAPRQGECAAFAVEQAKRAGVRMSGKTASLLVAIAGCDYYTIENEVAKIAVYAGAGNEITPEHVKECASRTLDFKIFELHNLLMRRDAAGALTLLTDVFDAQRPEGLVGLFAKKFRDMYRVKSLMDAGRGQDYIAETLKMKDYHVQMLMSDCARFTRAQLQDALMTLADLDFSVKSGEKDARIAVTQTLFRLYRL